MSFLVIKTPSPGQDEKVTQGYLNTNLCQSSKISNPLNHKYLAIPHGYAASKIQQKGMIKYHHVPIAMTVRLLEYQ